MYQSFKLIVIAALFILSGCKNVSGNSPEEKRPNFIFILVDDLGKEWISLTGADSVKTPAIDRLAETGLEFRNVWSMPQCTPSRVALLTGTYPFNNGWINHFDVPRWGHGARFDPQKNLTFANVLKDVGYKTCAAGKWQINDFRLEPEAMLTAGFDSYCMWTGGEGANEEISDERYWNPYIHTEEGSRVYEGQFGPDIFADFIIQFMKDNRDDPMMIYYPMVLTHGPLVHTPLEPEASTKAEKHRAMVRYTDHIVERLVKEMEELGIRENTYLIFTTDNGTAGNITGSRYGIPTRGGKTYLTENGVNAPFVVNAPGLIPEGVSTDALVDFTDVFPTLADLAGLDLPADYKLDGTSFAPVLKSGGEGERDWILTMGSLSGRVGEDGMIKNWKHFRDRALRGEQYKVYVDTLQHINRLFDLWNDPLEKKNLVGDPAMAEVLDRFEKVVLNLPSEDNQPDYVPMDTSYYDVPPENLVKSHKKDLGRSNMSPPAKGHDSRPNIVFIITDDQHRDQFNYLPEGRDDQGKALNLTPNMDRLASEGVILDQCYVSTSVCTPSRYSMLTGTYASRAKNENFLADARKYDQTNVHWNVDLIPETPNIAKALSGHGYFTGGVGKNHVIAADNVFNVPGDADPLKTEVENMLIANQKAQLEAYKANGFDYAASIYKGNLPHSYPLALEDHNMDWIVKGALDFIDRAASGEAPFFLYFATTLQHGPDKPGTKYLGNPLVTPVGFLDEPLEVMPSRESISRRIEAEGLPVEKADILWLDDGIGALLAKLEETGELANTIIFFMNDHAVEHGKGSLYQGGIHTTGFVWGPKYVEGAMRTQRMVSNIDFAPTVLDICNIQPNPGYQMDGKSFYPLLKGSDQAIHKSLYFEIGATRAVLMDGWKYLAFRTPEGKLSELEIDGKRASHINDRPGGRGSEQPAIRYYPHYFDSDQLYNIKDDPEERNNLYEKMKETGQLEALKTELSLYLEKLPGDFAGFTSH